MKTVEFIEKEYLPEQQKLLDIFKQHLQSDAPELPVIFKMPRTRKYRKAINHIPCNTIGGQGDYHIISMKHEDFARLLVKSGIEVRVYDD